MLKNILFTSLLKGSKGAPGIAKRLKCTGKGYQNAPEINTGDTQRTFEEAVGISQKPGPPRR